MCKPGRGGSTFGNGVDDDRRGGDVAVNAAGKLHGQLRRAVDLDRVVASPARRDTPRGAGG